ncbi:MAG: N-acetyl-gamma-glutamyl-phosphate reductase [Kofleriaceae bacterium]|nr:N-acetyl-gamma-glutamyl-phosphate reductase [Kofleriaceae bacterium]
MTDIPKPIAVAVIGASGYTGVELLRLLALHPDVTVVAVAAKRAAGRRIDEVFGNLRGVLDLMVEEFDAVSIAARATVAFCALPHGESAAIVAELVTRGVRVFDLSADFRLHEEAVWRQWYGQDGAVHPAAMLLADAVYGLPELHRSALCDARLVAVPGCYPTASILAIAPLLAAGLVDAHGLIVDAKSGVSGAGRAPSSSAHFPEVGEGIRAYKVAGTHRHTPEIEQELSLAAGTPLNILFTPHLVPMSRGILACVYAMPTTTAVTLGQLRDAMHAAYDHEPFVTVLPAGALPDTALVRGSNRAHIAVDLDVRTGRVLAMAAIDNLVKGAAGQAVQCMNITLGLVETAGLMQVAMFP